MEFKIFRKMSKNYCKFFYSFKRMSILGQNFGFLTSKFVKIFQFFGKNGPNFDGKVKISKKLWLQGQKWSKLWVFKSKL